MNKINKIHPLEVDHIPFMFFSDNPPEADENCSVMEPRATPPTLDLFLDTGDSPFIQKMAMLEKIHRKTSREFMAIMQGANTEFGCEE